MTKETKGRCCFGKCKKQGKEHKWGYGFRFCEEHMGKMIKLERGQITPSYRDKKKGTCPDCRKYAIIVGRERCSTCYKNLLKTREHEPTVA